MKQSYKIIISLAVIFIIGVSALLIYSRNSQTETQTNFQSNSQTNSQSDLALSDEAGDGEEAGIDSAQQAIVPFTSIAEKDGILYTSQSNAGLADFDGAQIIPIDSYCFAIIGEDVYYITPGDEEYAPELRRCGTDGNNDISITEFASPLGSPTLVGDSVYSAYYTDTDGGLNNGIYRYIIPLGETRKEIDGEFFVYGYDTDYIYYTNNESPSSGTVLYRMDYDGGNKTEILNYPSYTDSIVVYDKYIFFSAFDSVSHCCKIYRSPKDGNGNIDEYSFECMSDIFDVIDGRIYYQADGALYSSLINGDDETRLTDLEDNSQSAYGFLKLGDVLYYKEYSEAGDRYFSLEIETGKKNDITK